MFVVVGFVWCFVYEVADFFVCLVVFCFFVVVFEVGDYVFEWFFYFVGVYVVVIGYVDVFVI